MEALTQREVVVINALRIISHTTMIDEPFMRECIAKATVMSETPGFGNLLEQNEEEFACLLEQAKGCKSALEIGSRYGKSIERIAQVLEPKSRVVSVDLATNDAEGTLLNPTPILKQSMHSIAGMGHEAHLLMADSHDARTVAKVKELGPYEFVFIDGDHSYAGVKADWENYGPLATKIVAFHDIINNVDCARLWREIKAEGYKTVEYTQSIWLGIGVLFKEGSEVAKS